MPPTTTPATPAKLISFSRSTAVKSPLANLTPVTDDQAGDAQIEVRVTVPVGSTTEIDVSIPAGKVLSLAASVSPSTPIVNGGIRPGSAGQPTSTTPAAQTVLSANLLTNSTSTPDNTFALAPKQGLNWSAGSSSNPNPSPITRDVTKLFVVNTGTVPLTFQAIALLVGLTSTTAS